MSSELVYLVLGLGLLLASILPRVVEGRAMSVPMVVLGFGFLAGLVIPGRDPMSPLLDARATSHLAEATVIISLMGVGLALERPLNWRTWSPTWRMILVAMPLTIAAVALLGWWAVGLSVPAAILLGAVLAPTDPVLADEVQVGGPVTEGAVEGAQDGDVESEEDEVRFTLTSEAGLNDAAAFPFVYLGLFLMGRGAWQEWGLEWVLWTLLGKIVIGCVVGWVAGRALGSLLFRVRLGGRRVAEIGTPLFALAVTFAVYGLTELIHGYGFLAVFVAALALRSAERNHGVHTELHTFIERSEMLLTLVLLLMIGAAMSAGLFAGLTWGGAALGLLLVLVVRPVVGWVSLLGCTQADRAERAAIAWFGVRGVGSIYYLAYALSSEHVEEGLELWSVVGFTITVSVVIHGLLATPVMRRLDERRHRETGAAAERPAIS
ncbi:cation:proton antiporter [Ornithinimicrobium cerasi]|uniref:cation:proton antiporter n=1 Tax=Ornithinimicrobium cerasi TaxID=2248773 RepID=UPI000EFFAC06|nr:cation:proton antiporter [Ornithinimicrobium cerasi]